MGWNNWTEFKPFTDYFEIKHLVGYQGRRGLWKTTLEEETGYLSQADGLFPVQGGAFDHNINVPVGIYFIRIAGGENHHPSGFFDYIGLSTPSDKGRSKFQKGIYSRIFEHYGKILGIPQRGDIGNYINAKKKSEMNDQDIHKIFEEQEFKDYQAYREFFMKCSKDEYSKVSTRQFRQITEKFAKELSNLQSIKNFFSSKVTFCFNTYSGNGTDAIKDISKGEGLALNHYKNIYREYPFLNERDEGIALRGFLQEKKHL